MGYLTWRRDQGQRAGELAADVMRESGYNEASAERVARMIPAGAGLTPKACQAATVYTCGERCPMCAAVPFTAWLDGLGAPPAFGTPSADP